LQTHLDYQTGGLWRGVAWGHPVWLLAYRDAPVEEDTVPLRLLDLDGAPRELGGLVLQRERLHPFATWLSALQPQLWEEIRKMAGPATDRPLIDWEAVAKIADLGEVIRVLPPERVIQELGIERAVEVIGLPRVIEAAGLPRVIEAVGLPRVIE